VRDDLPACGHSGASPRLVLATLTLIFASVAMTVFATPLQRYTSAAATQLGDRAAYARAVLAEQGGEAADTARPYRLAPAAPASAPTPPGAPR
jgi:multicomponent K+:H+ antiporter subunit D